MTEKPKQKVGSSPSLVRLAADLSIDPRDLALRLDPDVVRRTKYPVIEERQPDGRIVYRHPVMSPKTGPISRIAPRIAP